MKLKQFENLNHVGGVVTSFDEEKTANLFNLLLQEMAKRKKKKSRWSNMSCGQRTEARENVRAK